MKGKTKRKTSVLLAVLLAVLMIVSFATLNLSNAKSQSAVFAADEATLDDWAYFLGLYDENGNYENYYRVTHILVNVNMDQSTDFTQPQYTSVGENVYATLVDNGESIHPYILDEEAGEYILDETQTATGLTVTFCTKADRIYLPEYCSSLFERVGNVKEIDTSKFDTSRVTDMNGMFSDCMKLTTLDVSNWNTSSVTNMFSMFRNCSALTTLDLSNWNTSSVTDMGEMFYGCNSLTTLNVSNWSTASVTNMNGMFLGCPSLTMLDLSSFHFDAIESADNMFGEPLSMALDMLNGIEEGLGEQFLNANESGRIEILVNYMGATEEEAQDMLSQIGGPTRIVLPTAAIPEQLVDQILLADTYVLEGDTSGTEYTALVQAPYEGATLVLKSAAQQGSGAGDNTPSTGVVTDIVLPSVATIAMVIALAYVLKNKKKEQF